MFSKIYIPVSFETLYLSYFTLTNFERSRSWTISIQIQINWRKLCTIGYFAKLNMMKGGDKDFWPLKAFLLSNAWLKNGYCQGKETRNQFHRISTFQQTDCFPSMKKYSGVKKMNFKLSNVRFSCISMLSSFLRLSFNVKYGPPRDKR